MRLLSGLAPRYAAAVAGPAVLALAIIAGTVPALGLSLETRREDRALLHRNAPRGLEYVPTSRAGASGKAQSSLKVDVLRKIELDGNAIDNVYSNLLPLDGDGDGKFGLVHWNGHRIMRLYDLSGRKRWQITNAGRKQGSEAFIHRDTAAVLDLDGDKRDDILHCWQSGSIKRLVARKGTTGKAIRYINLSGQSNSTGSLCRLAVYRKESDKKPIILVAHTQPGGSAKCGNRNWADNWTRVVAFDTKLKKLWHRDTCDAGHHTAQVDADKDGYAEYFFVGKYALDFKGKIRCVLQGWKTSDHVDGIRIAQLDPKKSAMTAVAVGRTGAGAFSASTCKRLWSAPIKNVQEVAVAQFDPVPRPLSILMMQKGDRKGGSAYVLDASGKIIRKIAKRIVPMQNASLDNDKRTDEIVAMFGEVYSGTGKRLLSRSWYWNLKGTKVRHKSSSNVYDKWDPFPLLFDVDHDHRAEIITWGQSLIVVGRPR